MITLNIEENGTLVMKADYKLKHWWRLNDDDNDKRRDDTARIWRSNDIIQIIEKNKHYPKERIREAATCSGISVSATERPCVISTNLMTG